MIDIHSHILPYMDDGSRSVEESIQMLETAAQQNVKLIAATPHFYATQNSPEEFMSRRKKAVERLYSSWRPEFPKLALGAEVYYFDGITRTEKLNMLKIEHTDMLLLEMPFTTWTDRMISDVLELQMRNNMEVVLAHIERYYSKQKTAVWDMLLDSGIRMQCNAEFFLNRFTRHKALRMVRQKKVHCLGSDCHNMSSRPPQLGEAISIISKVLGSEVYRHMEDETAALLSRLEEV